MVRKYTFLRSCPAQVPRVFLMIYLLSGRYPLYKYTPFPPISLPGSSIILKNQGFPLLTFVSGSIQIRGSD